MKYQIDTQTVLETFKMNGNSLAHLLLITDSDSFDIPNVEYIVRCGGALNPKNIHVESAFMIPLCLASEIFARQGNDHLAGCSNLNWKTNPELVKRFADNFDRVLPSIYAESSTAKISVDRSNLESLLEGFIPVVVSGIFLSGPHIDKPVKGYVITGNCI